MVTRGAEHQVTVGGPGVLAYNPDYVNANPGDTVIFTFKQKNHTATQSTLDNPCEQMPGGFDSGFVPVADNNTDGPFTAAQFTVKDTNPVWVFCRQTGHCQQGMVFAINPADKFPEFQANAKGNTTANSSTPALPASAPPASAAATVTATVTVTAPPASSTSTDHIVTVGGPNALVYTPANITAQPGDTVTFRFLQTNHTVTQSSFGSPCAPLSQTSTSGQAGFDSGFMPVAANASASAPPTYTIQVNDTAPIWAFCRQTSPKSHCGAGMVFSVNAGADGAGSFAAFQARAVQLNGTGAASGSAGAPSATPNGARAMGADRSAGAAVTVVFLGVVVGSMLF
ncbi:Cupredoxin [Amylocystis lapponica]|nr:Cupredoxin [Amylocystis lapponica]